MEDTMAPRPQEEMIASFLVLLIGRLLNWADVPKGGGDPQFLTAEQTEALAAQGISLLARYLPPETAKGVTTAVERHAHRRHHSLEEAFLHVGALGGIVSVGSPDGPPGCCVFEPGRGLVCVR
jgi:hypothetical protein